MKDNFKKTKSMSSIVFIIFFPLLTLALGGFLGGIILGSIYLILYSNIRGIAISSSLSLLINATVIILVAFIIVKLKEKRGPQTLGLKVTKNTFNKHLKGFLIGLSMMLITVISITLMTKGTIRFKGLTKEQVLPFVFIILAWLMQGASEEILIRGYLFPTLALKTGLKYSFILSSIYFAILHVANDGMNIITVINIILAGMFAALYALCEGDIWGACGWHSAWNFAQGNLFGLSVSGTESIGVSLFETSLPNQYSWITGGEFGPEGSIVVTLIFLIVLAIFSKKYESKKRDGS